MKDKPEPAWLARMALAVTTYQLSSFAARGAAEDVRTLRNAALRVLEESMDVIDHAEPSLRDCQPLYSAMEQLADALGKMDSHVYKAGD